MLDNELNGKQALVIGLGQSGISAANLLYKLGASVAVTDLRQREELEAAISRLEGKFSFYLGGHNGIDPSGFNLAVVSPGIPWGSVVLRSLRENGVEMISELELAARYIRAPVIGVTGTNGKTTTASLIAEIFRKGGKKFFLGGNIGIPLSEFVLSGEEADFVVCEVSTFQLEGVKRFRPYISVILNVTPDHLDRHSDMEEYVGLKKRIYQNQKEGDFLVLNLDDSITVSLTTPFGVKVHYFSRSGNPEEGTILKMERLFIKKEGVRYPLCNRKDIPLRGLHNVENVLAAVAVASICGITPEIIRSALTEFKGIKNRMEFVSEISGVNFINDSKGTNVGAAVRSIESVEAPVVLIAGGKDKGGDYTPLKEIIEKKVKSLVLIGEAGQKISSLVNGFSKKIIASSLTEAVEIAFRQSEKGDVVLLSPACSSFDMFRNYEERGECFRNAVKKLKGSLMLDKKP